MFTYILLEIIALVIGLACLIVIFYFYLIKKTNRASLLKQKRFLLPFCLFLIAIIVGFLAQKTYPPNFAMPSFMHSHAPGGLPPSIPFGKIVDFIKNKDRFEKIIDIGADPNTVPKQPIKPDEDGVVRIELRAKEVLAEVAPGIWFNYWTYNGQVPGPMLKVKEGDTVEISLTNDPSSLHDHNIDLHAVTGPGGGASLTHTSPGETKTFRWKALNPGLYIYHCAMPNVSTHNSHGQYGLILVEPQQGLLTVDKEFYVVQGELYTMGDLGKRGLVAFDSKALLDGKPNYVFFNGKIETTARMSANVGDRIRIYLGNGGVNLISSFHVIGEIFDTVYPNASMNGVMEHNTQTTAILPGGASIVEFTVDVPGKYLLVDHALARMNKGAWAVLDVTGDPQPDFYKQIDQKYSKHSH